MSRVQLDHVISGTETKGWVHTHGMDRLGLPELEMRNVPGFLVESAASLLEHICDYMIDSGKRVSVGETMTVSKRTAFRFVKAEPIPGQDNHYETERWQIVEVECQCADCGISPSEEKSEVFPNDEPIQQGDTSQSAGAVEGMPMSGKELEATAEAATTEDEQLAISTLQFLHVQGIRLPEIYQENGIGYLLKNAPEEIVDFLSDSIEEDVYNAICEAEGIFKEIMVSALESMIGDQGSQQGEKQ